ncbi:MAG: hypothetical protein HYV97_02310 [Bdellovibrio sp.]|nr:hypothetical protein [Bdellovibrio sp.]
MKPTDLVHCPIRPTHINSYLIKAIEVDLRHINYGLSRTKGYGKKARSHFKIEDVISFFESLNFLEINSENDGDWEYFVVDKVFFDQKKKYRIVFCIDQKKPEAGGVITLFEIKRGKS